MSSESVKELTSATFDFETASGLVLVDFWAPWCAPCRMMAPIFDTVAEKLAGKATFVKVNIDESPDLPARFGIRSIPTLLLLKDGVEVDTHTGVMRPDDLMGMINRNV